MEWDEREKVHHLLEVYKVGRKQAHEGCSDQELVFKY